MSPAAVVRTVLADYLRSQLETRWPEVSVRGEWPDPGDPLPERVVAVLQAGPPTVTQHPPVIHETIPGTCPNGVVKYCWGWAELPLQLEAWARYQTHRDELAGAVADALQRSVRDTLGLTSVPHFRRASGLVLRADDLGALCDFRFSPLPETPEASGAAQAGEWRATWDGTARFPLLDEQTAVLIKTIRLSVDDDETAIT